MGGLFSFLYSQKDSRIPIPKATTRIKNIVKCHFKGLIGCIIPLVVFSPFGIPGDHARTVLLVWLTMVWFFIWQPINVPITGMIPIFIFPMTGVLKTDTVAQCYFNEIIALLLLGGMLSLLINNSGLDRRLALYMICSGDNKQFSGKRLVFKYSSAAFFLSIISNRLIITSTVTQYVTSAFESLQSSTSRSRATEPNFDKMRHVMCQAIQISSTLGSVVLTHGALATLAFRAVWTKAAPSGQEYEDIFNYLQFTCFMFPVAFVMFILVMCYHMVLITWLAKRKMSASSLSEMRRNMIKHKEALKKINAHETLTAIFITFALLMMIFRWSNWLNMGWTSFNKHADALTIPVVRDSTVAAIFVLLTHLLPKGVSFIKIFKAKTKSQLPPAKAESSILWWKFVDKNTTYAYMFILGAGLAVHKAKLASGLKSQIGFIGNGITSLDFNLGLFLAILVSVIGANIMSGAACTAVLMPLIVNMGAAGSEWEKNMWRASLGCGIATSFGFMSPFLYTTAYFSHYTGKVPLIKMIKLSLIPIVLCVIVLWISLAFWAPVIWGSTIVPVTAPATPGEANTTPSSAESTPAAS